jgi:drug/metabolite transporter (DMT)-like permease
LQFTTPAFTAIIAVFLVGEKWLPLDQIGAVVCLLGVAFIAHPTWLFGAPADAGGEADAADSKSLLLKALAVLITEGGAVMAGLAYVSVRKIGHRASAVVMVLYYGALSIPMCVIGSGLLEGTWNPFFLDPSQYTMKDYFILLLMGVGGYGGQFFTNLGLQYESAATATLATCTQIVWTYIFELAFLHEGVNSWSLAGTAIILGYMLVVAFFKILESREKAQEEEHLLAEIHISEELEV